MKSETELEKMLWRLVEKIDRKTFKLSKKVEALPKASPSREAATAELFTYIEMKSEIELILTIYNQPKGEK